MRTSRVRITNPILHAIALLVAIGSAAAIAAPLCDPGSQTCRTFVLDNNCTQDLWIASMGNAASCTTDSDCPTATSTCAAQGCTCATDTDCASTQVCDTSQSPSVCRFAAPLDGGARLAKATSQTIYLPNQNFGTQPISWGGRFWARTGCPDFATCNTPGDVCTADADCCTNAGCQGLFTCAAVTDCEAFDCTTSSECPGGATCDTATGKCNGCLGSGQCACFADSDCRDGGRCVSGACTGQCGAGGVACQTGDCQSELECPVGSGGQAPTTLAEFALLSGASNYDTYDVSQVNGFNVPIMITPLGTTKAAPTGFANLQPWCGSPGCASASDCPGQNDPCGFTSEFPSCLCTWTLDDDTCPDPLQAVWPMTCSSDADCGGGAGSCDTSTVPNTCICRADSDCPGILTCGVNVNIDGKKRVCGTYTGCVDADSACTADKRLKGRADGKPFSCKRFKELYSCTGAHTGSCYTTGASAECCGCPSWSSGGNAGPFPIPNGCQESDHKWARVVDPVVKSFKSTCPTAYSFQYDDPTSTFNCDGKAGSPIGYTVTFCPAGSPGASPG
jgi:hypothetical protein